MTELDSKSLYDLARALFPKSKPEIAMALIEAVKLCPPDAVKTALKAHLTESEDGYLNVPEVLARVRRITGVNPLRDHLDRQRAARRKEAQDWEQKAQSDHEAAMAFCRAQCPEELDRMRAAIVGKYTPHSTERWRDKATLDSPYLVSLIYDHFGQPARRKERVSA